jgi:hypothetical protein
MARPRDGRQKELFRPSLNQIIDVAVPATADPADGRLAILKRTHARNDDA